MKTNTKMYKVLLLPVLLTAAITPLIIYGKAVPIGDTLFKYWSNERVHIDVFSYWKSVFVLAVSGIALLIMVYKKTFVKSFLYIPAAIYSVCVIVSGVLSEHKSTAIWGIADRHEGMLAQLAYVVIFIYTINYIDKFEHVKLVLHVLVISSMVIAIVGLFQFIGYDYLSSEVIQKLLIPSEYAMYISDIIFKAGDSFHYQNSIYSTLYNSNTFGLYMSLIIPTAAGITLTVKSKTGRILYGIVLLILAASLIGSNSRGSYIAVIVSIIIMSAFILIKKGQISYIRAAVFTAALIVIFIGMDNISGGNIAKRLTVSTPTVSQTSSESPKINNFNIAADTLHITNGIFNLDIKIENDKLLFIENKEVLDISRNADGIYSIAGEKYTGMDIKIENNLVSIIKNKSLLRFAIKDNTFYYVDAKGKIINTYTLLKGTSTDYTASADVLKIGFRNFEKLGSGRGYIWSRSLPLLKDTILFGKGSDNFIYYFPQSDYLGKLMFMNDANIVIDKPHNFYLQTAISSGIISLIAFLILIAYFAIRYFKAIKNCRSSNEIFVINTALYSSIMAFLVNGLFTDSSICATPVFWILLGLGFSQYYQTLKQCYNIQLGRN